MNFLLVSDIHLTSSPKDEYRWRLFDWLAATISERRVDYLFILGDLTEAKDFHSARLVNRVVNSLLNLFKTTSLFGVHILRGNHDGIDPGAPYFAFLGRYPAFSYISTPYAFELGGQQIAMLPHSRNPGADWKDSADLLATADLLLMHQTMTGALAENGQRLEGEAPSILLHAKHAQIFSGDVHVPQKVGRVCYVGAPHPVRFGDNYKPRAVLLEKGHKAVFLEIPAIQRRLAIVTAGRPLSAALKGLSAGDQVKVRVSVGVSGYADWASIKNDAVQECRRLGVELCGLELDRDPQQRAATELHQTMQTMRTPVDILMGYVQGKRASKFTADFGKELLGDVD